MKGIQKLWFETLEVDWVVNGVVLKYENNKNVLTLHQMLGTYDV